MKFINIKNLNNVSGSSATKDFKEDTLHIQSIVYRIKIDQYVQSGLRYIYTYEYTGMYLNIITCNL